MGVLGYIKRWAKDRANRPADPGLLDARRNPGSERIITSASADEANAAAGETRHARDRRRWKWISLGGGGR